MLLNMAYTYMESCFSHMASHCVLLPHLDGCMDIELWFSRRCIMFLNMAMDDSNVLTFWNHKCDNESDAVRLSVQVRELCG